MRCFRYYKQIFSERPERALQAIVANAFPRVLATWSAAVNRLLPKIRSGVAALLFSEPRLLQKIQEVAGGLAIFGAGYSPNEKMLVVAKMRY